MKTAMMIAPHADDAAAFCGGTLTKLAAEGWHVILVRVTDDQKDSIGYSVEETIRINTQEMHAAAKILGIAEIIELGFMTDCLADIPLGSLRERFVYLCRKHKPYAVLTFDPFGMYEGNQDHTRVAQAVEEAFWVSCFDKHYSEHFTDKMGKIHTDIVESNFIFGCKSCNIHLTSHSQRISKSFTGVTGKAYLFNNVYNN